MGGQVRPGARQPSQLLWVAISTSVTEPPKDLIKRQAEILLKSLLEKEERCKRKDFIKSLFLQFGFCCLWFSFVSGFPCRDRPGVTAGS